MHKLFRIFTAILASACLFGSAFAEGKVMVSLGDSYSSGEGIEPFYGQDDEMEVKCRNPDWLAHRSEKSWPGLLTLPGVDGTMADHRGENWFFAAASGAKTDQLLLLSEEEKREGMTAEQEKEYNWRKTEGTGILPPQLDIFNELDAKGLKADYVTVTIGGNDMGFAELVKLAMVEFVTLAAGKTPEEKTEIIWERYYVSAGVCLKIKRAFSDIAARAGGQACILVAGYPHTLEPDTGEKTMYFTEDSILIMNRLADRLNQELESITEECHEEGMNICFIPVDRAFEGHGAYAEDPWINPIIAGSEKQDLKRMMIASKYSMHPNEKGAQAYALCVQKVIDSLEKGGKN